MSNYKNIFRNFVLLICSVIFCFLLIEIGIRIFVKDQSHYFDYPQFLFEIDKKKGYRLTKNFKGIVLDSQADYVCKMETNSIGLRDREYGDKKDNTFRILVLGDSITFGLGVELEDTYPKQLETILGLRNDGKKYEVINAGVMGYGTDHEFYYLEEWGAKLKPDLVIVGFYVGNDVDDVMIGAQNLFTVKDGYLFDKYRHEGIESNKNIFKRHSKAYEFFADRVNNLLIKTGLKKGNSDLPENLKFYLNKLPYKMEVTMNKVETFLKKISNLEAQIGGKTIIILIPTRKQIFLQNNLDEDFERYKLNPIEYSPTKINDEIINFAKRSRIPLIDLLPIMKEEEEKIQLLLPGMSHWNKEGHKLVANTIYGFLISNQIIP